MIKKLKESQINLWQFSNIYEKGIKVSSTWKHGIFRVFSMFWEYKMTTGSILQLVLNDSSPKKIEGKNVNKKLKCLVSFSFLYETY